MSAAAGRPGKVTPAQLAFLTIYNPSLGTTDESFCDQVVFHYSREARARSKSKLDNAALEKERREGENEKLRQIGLAQGMVGFARSFSNGEAVDSVETERSRIVLHELEKGWWILASVDLTRLPVSSSSAKSSASQPTPAIEYSSREVSPAALLLQQLLRAHSIFLLHHGQSLSDLFAKNTRKKFCGMLDRFWIRFATNWDVLLHGNPAVDVHGGIKLAAGGELGIGVGEEEWGSGEREVLEHLAGRTEGLVDLVVSRFSGPSEKQQLGQVPSHKKQKKTAIADEPAEPWLANGAHPEAADGVIFSGMGAISRSSIRDVSSWMESIYAYGEYAYGVKDNPNSDRRKRRRKQPSESGHSRSSSGRQLVSPKKSASPPKGGGVEPETSRKTSHGRLALPPGIPPPLVTAVEDPPKTASSEAGKGVESDAAGQTKPSGNDTVGWMNYLTLGYGSSWGARQTPPSRSSSQQTMREDGEASNLQGEPPLKYIEPEPEASNLEEKLRIQVRLESNGYFMVGFQGDLDEGGIIDPDEGGSPSAYEPPDGDWESRTLVRTVYCEMVTPRPAAATLDIDDEGLARQAVQKKYTRLRTIVYVHRPFIYTFLFHPRTASLGFPSFYRTLHSYLSPLHKPLSASTAPSRVAARISAAMQHPQASSSPSSSPNPILDLVYDPQTLTVHASIPNIPEPGTTGEASVPGWARVEALNVHSQILAMVKSTRAAPQDVERTCKTSRGWWVVWMRVPPPGGGAGGCEPVEGATPDAAEGSDTETQTAGRRGRQEWREPAAEEPARDDRTPSPPPTSPLREAFLVRRARDAVPSGSRAASSGGIFGLGSRSPATVAGQSSRIGEGIGVDARRYVEGLLAVNR